jgi:hypothetical protein
LICFLRHFGGLRARWIVPLPPRTAQQGTDAPLFVASLWRWIEDGHARRGQVPACHAACVTVRWALVGVIVTGFVRGLRF